MEATIPRNCYMSNGASIARDVPEDPALLVKYFKNFFILRSAQFVTSKNANDFSWRITTALHSHEIYNQVAKFQLQLANSEISFHLEKLRQISREILREDHADRTRHPIDHAT